MTSATTDKIEEQVFGMVADVVGLSADILEKNNRLKEDLGYDSLDEVELVMAIEERYGFSISDEAAENIKTAGDVLEQVRLKLSA